MTRLLRLFVFAFCMTSAQANDTLLEPVPPKLGEREVALTLDACGGDFDWGLAHFLVERRIRTTLFVTEIWIQHNPEAAHFVRAHRDVFAVENHGTQHHALVLGTRHGPYNVPAVETPEGLRAEVLGGQSAIQGAFGTEPHWFRGATALYSPAAVSALSQAGWRVAGFSISIDNGATLPANKVAKKTLAVQGGEVLLGHINKPHSGTREGLEAALPQLLEHGFQFVWLPTSR